MRSKKDWNRWFDNLHDNDLENLFEKRNLLEKTPKNYDDDIYNFISKLSKKDIKKTSFIEKIKNYYMVKPVLSYGITFASVLFFIVFGFFFKLKLFPIIQNRNKCIVTYVRNDVYKIDLKNKKTKLIEESIINKKDTVELSKDSGLHLNLGKKTKIELDPETSIYFSEIHKKNNMEFSLLKLNKGEALFNLEKLNKDSSFLVETDTIIIGVSGTKFSVSFNKEKTTKVNVIEGKVSIQPKIDIKEKIKSISNKDIKFSKQISDAVNEKFYLEKGDSLEISFKDFTEFKNEINNIINIITEDINKASTEIEINNTVIKSKPKLQRIKKLKLNLYNKSKNKESKQIDTNLNNEDPEDDKTETTFTSKKIGKLPNVVFTEKNTAVSSDYNNIYIASDSNSTVYSINTSTGKLKWTFKDPGLQDITSPVVIFKNNIVLPSFNKIYILDNSGNIKNTFPISKGTNFWADSIIIKNNLYIPTPSGIYVFNGISLIPLENSGNTLGQLYISSDNSNIYLIDSNDLILKRYNLEIKNIDWTSEKINNRVFSSPIKIKNYIITTDYKNSIYRFNPNSGEKSSDVLNINIGVISNILSSGNYIYFTANNGWLYGLNVNNFDKVIPLFQVDKNPDYNNYLTKNLLKVKNSIYFSSNSGNLIHFDIKEFKTEIINIEDNKSKNPLIGTPVYINDNIYVIDIKANIYQISKNN